MHKFTMLLFLSTSILLGGCETTDSQLVQQGRSSEYVIGFHDGRHSGIKEAGNPFDHFIRDEKRFAEDDKYRAGWLDGEIEGKRLQAQADNVGKALGNAYTTGKVQKELDKNDPDRVADDVLKNTDTSVLKNLEK